MGDLQVNVTGGRLFAVSLQVMGQVAVEDENFPPDGDRESLMVRHFPFILVAETKADAEIRAYEDAQHLFPTEEGWEHSVVVTEYILDTKITTTPPKSIDINLGVRLVKSAAAGISEERQ